MYLRLLPSLYVMSFISRAMYNEGFTGAHVDNVYMSRGSSEVCTIWTPFGDVPLEMGTLAVVEGSHKLPGY